MRSSNCDDSVPTNTVVYHHIWRRLEIESEIEIVYSMYRVKPADVYGPSRLCHGGNL
jgi:hypothetical protein